MAKVFARGDATPLALPGRTSREVVSSARGADRVSLRLVTIEPQKPGEAPRGPHVHYACEEVIYVVSGEGTTKATSGEFPLKPGDTLLVPAGELHVTRNTGREPLSLLCFFPDGDVASGTEEFADWNSAKAAS
jgi:mannose-6-phosphate isomerase-like protein (cupin superfamily)